MPTRPMCFKKSSKPWRWNIGDFRKRRKLDRFAKARMMADGCVRCHNGHNESTKKDWKVGELGGVLEIIRPLDQNVARTHAGLRGTFVVVASISGSLVALSGPRDLAAQPGARRDELSQGSRHVPRAVAVCARSEMNRRDVERIARRGVYGSSYGT